ncbi:MAG: YvcK family protein [Chloroflexaceae bacterium]|nr:YvcK family protein [Chloroflexaceae bacterium]
MHGHDHERDRPLKKGHPDEHPERHIVAIGGGSGVSQVLLGSQPYFSKRTAIVAVTDTGRSTGLARAIGDMPAPGDLRNALANLSDNPNSLMVRLVQHRLTSPGQPPLDGMAFGNLLIAALKQMTSDFAQAIETVRDLLTTSVQVLPVSIANTHLCAELEDGSMMQDELAVRGINKAPIRRLFLADATATAYPPAVATITSADIVAIGPGSFYTSVLATLLFQGITEALRQTRATVVFVCNTTTQPGQTDGYQALDHIQRLVALVGPGVIDAVLVNRSDQVDPALLARYAAEGIYLLQPYDDEIQRIEALGVHPLVNDYCEQPSPKRELWNKQDTIRHDPARLGQALWHISQTYGTEPAGHPDPGRSSPHHHGC